MFVKSGFVMAIAFVVNGCASVPGFHFADHEQLQGDRPYASIHLLANGVDRQKPSFPKQAIRNIQFRYRHPSGSQFVFSDQSQMLVVEHMIAIKDPSTEQYKYLYIYPVYRNDSNEDGIINERDQCQIVSYDPELRRTYVLIDVADTFQYLKENYAKGAFSFLMVFVKNGIQYQNEYDMKDVSLVSTRELGKSNSLYIEAQRPGSK